MKALVLPHYGSWKDLQIQEVDDPKPQADEAIIKVMANGICFHDVIACRGDFPRTKTPGILGHETAGEIVEMGGPMSGLKVGDRVIVNMMEHCGNCSPCRRGDTALCSEGEGLYGEAIPGGYAEYMPAKLNSLIKIPEGITAAEASIIPCPVGTAYHAITRRALVKPGEDVLVTGATGGVGIHAVQIARMIGARVIAVTTSANKVDVLKAQGADEVVVSPNLDFSAEVRELTQGRGVNVILNIVGEVAWKASLKSMASQARHVFIGNVKPTPVEIRPALAVLKELSFLGTLGVSIAEVEELVRLVANGRLKPMVNEIVPLSGVKGALHQMEERGMQGRIVLDPFAR